MCNCVAYNRFNKLRFLHLYLLFFLIPIYAEIRCLQHSVTYQWQSNSTFNFIY